MYVPCKRLKRIFLSSLDGVNDQGKCITDTFGVTSPGAQGSPIICGTNSGYHSEYYLLMGVFSKQKNTLGNWYINHDIAVILDSDGASCLDANFFIGTSTTVTRSWKILVTQYNCGQEDVSGPPGCLQYHSSSSGYIQK